MGVGVGVGMGEGGGGGHGGGGWGDGLGVLEDVEGGGSRRGEGAGMVRWYLLALVNARCIWIYAVPKIL